jgi:hypothetical protein
VKFSTGGIVREQAFACRACGIQAPTVKVRMKEDAHTHAFVQIRRIIPVAIGSGIFFGDS